MYGDIYNSLSQEHKKIVKKYIRFCIRGKLGRTVPVLLSNALFECINLIIKYRKEAKVPEKNLLILIFLDYLVIIKIDIDISEPAF